MKTMEIMSLVSKTMEDIGVENFKWVTSEKDLNRIEGSILGTHESLMIINNATKTLDFGGLGICGYGSVTDEDEIQDIKAAVEDYVTSILYKQLNTEPAFDFMLEFVSIVACNVNCVADIRTKKAALKVALELYESRMSSGNALVGIYIPTDVEIKKFKESLGDLLELDQMIDTFIKNLESF